ncbi:hypothetical protein A33M_0701 [Rhodovulum sp. PH10]|uniref:DUF5615 family PIN-like protein n=1 Tax=Rhodovulum sp. PH10 TaxID=1187851 RepID=UPI00027C2CAA|nr:DUF5615 family PIN-like protein [Rhodovulum sp. PH10]EJW09989.1 hypothetical protein A33M_0701 [Rhodovulum sp. PH10]
MSRLLIDECLSVGLVAVAKSRGVAADHVTWLGKSGWQDRNLVAFAVDGDYLMVTNNRRHFLREYAKLAAHLGLVVIVPALPRAGQSRLFEAALDTLAAREDEGFDRVVEVLADGRVTVREWTLAAHDPGHIDHPSWD